MTDLGPCFTYSDSDKSQFGGDDLDTHLQNLSISFLISLGQSFNFIDAVFDLPVGKDSEYRALLVSLNIGSKEIQNIFEENLVWVIGVFRSGTT